MLSGEIGNFKYLTQEDILHLFHVYVNDEQVWENFQEELREISFLTKEYANKLDTFERLYDDDWK